MCAVVVSGVVVVVGLSGIGLGDLFSRWRVVPTATWPIVKGGSEWRRPTFARPSSSFSLHAQNEKEFSRAASAGARESTLSAAAPSFLFRNLKGARDCGRRVLCLAVAGCRPTPVGGVADSRHTHRCRHRRGRRGARCAAASIEATRREQQVSGGGGQFVFIVVSSSLALSRRERRDAILPMTFSFDDAAPFWFPCPGARLCSSRVVG